MARVKCKGCDRLEVCEVRQVRIYARLKQFQLKFVLCRTCWGGLFDLMKDSSDGWTEGLWSPIYAQVAPAARGGDPRI